MHNLENVTAPRESIQALQVRCLVLRDRLAALASKVQLLTDMGLVHTAAYKDACKLYEEKLAEVRDIEAAIATVG